jgi:hypothetical protein
VVELRGYTYHKDTENYIINTLVENIARQVKMKAVAAAAAPAPDVAAPVPDPASPAPAPDPAKPDAAGKSEHPVIGRVSHVLMFRAQVDEKFDPNAFTLTTASELPRLLGQAGGGFGGLDDPRGAPVPPAGGAGEGGIPAPTFSRRTSWVPLPNAQMQAGEGGEGGAAIAGPGNRFVPQPMPQPARPWGEGRVEGGVPGEGVDNPFNRLGLKLKRTEFIVLFIWKEHIPSEKNRPKADPYADPYAQPASPAAGF